MSDVEQRTDHDAELARLRAIEAAARAVVEHLHDEGWWESRAVCGNAFHTTRRGGAEWCPDCGSSWWATDGSLPDGSEYAVEGALRFALLCPIPKKG